MSLRSWIKRFPVALLLLLVPRAVAAEKLNIVYILADDLGYGDLGCYGQKSIATPQIDRLAAEGVRFTQHYAGSAVCGPSRSCLLTGLHTGHARHRTNARFVDSEAFLPTDTTFAEVMKAAGYATAICGKWHLGDRADTSGPPQHHGFDFTYCVGHPYPEGGVEHWPSHVRTFHGGSAPTDADIRIVARRKSPRAGTAHQEVTVTAG